MICDVYGEVQLARCSIVSQVRRSRPSGFIRLLFVAVTIPCLANHVQGQSVSPASYSDLGGSQRADSLITAAEAAGAMHPRAERQKSVSAEWKENAWWGSEERKCVEVRGMGPVRSGEFIIGGELGGRPAILPRVPAKIWWAPLHNGERMDSLIIVGERLSSPMQMRLALGTVAFVMSPGQSIPPTDREYFFPSGTVIPDWGRWLLVASSGPNWGCFIVTSGRG